MLAYIGNLFEENCIHGRSVDHYISAVRTRHFREGFEDPFSGNHHVDLVRAFRHQDDQRGELQDVRAAIPADVIARIRRLSLEASQGSLLEYQAAMVEFQFLLSWRENSVRTVQVQDINMEDRSDTSRETGFLTLTARPRSLQGRLVRGVGPCSLTCRHSPEAFAYRNPLALQWRFYQARRSSANRDVLYWALDGVSLRPQVVSEALTACMEALDIHPPPLSSYSSHSSPRERHGAGFAQCPTCTHNYSRGLAECQHGWERVF